MSTYLVLSCLVFKSLQTTSKNAWAQRLNARYVTTSSVTEKSIVGCSFGGCVYMNCTDPEHPGHGNKAKIQRNDPGAIKQMRSKPNTGVPQERPVKDCIAHEIKGNGGNSSQWTTSRGLPGDATSPVLLAFTRITNSNS